MPEVFGAVNSAGNAVAVGVTVVATVVVLALLVTIGALLRSARRLQRAAALLERDAKAVLAELGQTVADAGDEVERVGDLIGSAESITETVASASRMAYVTLANPVIKALAFGSGAARVSHRLRHPRSSPLIRRSRHVVARSRSAR